MRGNRADGIGTRHAPFRRRNPVLSSPSTLTSHHRFRSMKSSYLRPFLRTMAVAALFAAAGIQQASAERITNPVAEFAGLDKITGRIITFDVYMDETVQFGALQITPRACYTRPPTETQRTSVFVEVDQVSLRGTVERVFTGWMFADSPALNAIDHAVYDIWLIDCKQSSDVPPPDQPAPSSPAPVEPPAEGQVDDRG